MYSRPSCLRNRTRKEEALRVRRPVDVLDRYDFDIEHRIGRFDYEILQFCFLVWSNAFSSPQFDGDGTNLDLLHAALFEGDCRKNGSCRKIKGQQRPVGMPKKMLTSSVNVGDRRPVMATPTVTFQLGKVANVVANEWSCVRVQMSDQQATQRNAIERHGHFVIGFHDHVSMRYMKIS